MRLLYRFMMMLSGLSMVTAFLSVLLGIIAREARWDLPGLDAYAGYAVAATLFLALPSTLIHGDHIRVTLLSNRLKGRAARMLETTVLAVACLLSSAVAFFSCRLVWVSYVTHDMSPAADASPLWIPQITMALGCIGFAIAFIDALVSHLRNKPFFIASSDDFSRVE